MRHSAASEKLIWRRNQRQSELDLHIWRIAMNLTDVSDLDLRDGNSQFASVAASSLSMNKKPYLEEEGRSEAGFAGIVGQSRALQEVLQLVEMVATTDSTVLLLGETGTGKELIARAVHDRSRREGPERW